MTNLRELRDANIPAKPQPSREQYQLHDFILIAVHRACDLREFAAAKQLLASAEAAIKERAKLSEAKRRHTMDALVAAHERLWTLRNDPDSSLHRIKVV